MLHKAWNSKGEMLYCYPRSSIKFQGHTVQNITDFDPNWAFPDYRPVAAFKSLRFALFLSVETNMEVFNVACCLISWNKVIFGVVPSKLCVLNFSVISGGKLFLGDTTLDLKHFVASVVFVLYLCNFSPILVLWLCIFLFVVSENCRVYCGSSLCVCL